jgi:hypothetical protein
MKPTIPSRSLFDPVDLASRNSSAVRFRQFAAGIGGLLFASIFLLLPAPVQGQCPQWVVTAEWRLWQGDGSRVLMKLEQNQTEIKGQASYPIPHNPDRTGVVFGTVKGDNFNLQISWGDGQLNVYNGRIGPDGMIEGNTYDKAKPENKEPWFSDAKAMKCADTVAKPATPQTATTTPTP